MIRRGATNFILKAAGGLLIIAANAVCARWLSPESYGNLVSILSFCALFGGLSAFGSDHFFKRYFGDRAGQTFPISLGSYPTVLSALAVVVSLPVLPLFVAGIDTLTWAMYLGVAGLMVCVSIQRALSGALIGLGMPNVEAAVSGIGRYGLLLSGLVAFFLMSSKPPVGLDSLIVFYIAAYATAVVILYLCARHGHHRHARAVVKEEADDVDRYVGVSGLFRYIKESVPLTVLGAIGLIERNIDTLMLAAIAGPGAAGQYYVITRVSVLAMMPMQALNATVSRGISRSLAKRDLHKTSVLATRNARISSVVVLLMLAVLCVLQERTFLIFGQHYADSWVYLVGFLFGWFVRALIGPVNLVAILSDNAAWASRAASFFLLLNIGLNAILIPFFGVLGAVVATVLTRIARAGAIALFLHKRIGIDVTALKLRA